MTPQIAITGGQPSGSRQVFADRNKSRTQHQIRNRNTSGLRYPFNMYRADEKSLSVWPGAVNDYYPTLNAKGLDDPNAPTTAIYSGTSYYYIVADLETDVANANFGQFKTNEETGAVTGLSIERYQERQTGLIPWNQPRICIARVVATDLTGDGVFSVAIYNEVFSSLQLLQFFDRYIFMPYFIPAELVATQQQVEE